MPLHLECLSGEYIQDIGLGFDFEIPVIPPPVGVADLNTEGVKLCESLDLCFAPHPTKRLNLIAQREFQIIDHRQRALLRRGRKSLFDIKFAQRLSEICVNLVQNSLPSRPILFGAGKSLPIESEIFSNERLTQNR